MTTERLPFVSIVMPIRNEEKFIARSLEAVLNQDYPADRIEVLIADGMSNDATLEVINNLPGSDRVRVIPNTRRIQAAGLNKAIQNACGDVIVRVDGHTVIAPDYVSQCVATLRTTVAANVGGSMNPVGITPMGKAIAAAGKSVFAVPSAFHVSQKAQFTDTVYLGAWPRQVFDQVGLFNEQVGVNEDYELNYRIRQTGGRIYFSPDIRSQYLGRQTINALAYQYFRYGRSKVKTLRVHPRSLRLRQLVAPAFVAYVLGGIPLAMAHPTLAGSWLAGVISYVAVNLFFSIRTAVLTNWISVWRLSIVFCTIHFAWGLGFWVEIVNPS